MSGSADGGPIRWGRDGLATAVAVDATSGDVLMVASMNAEALARTRETGVVHYWSRSRNALWRKGETSGHVQRLVEIRVNCNRDSLLLRVEQQGAVCHDGYPTCYYRRLEADDSLSVVGVRAFDPADVYDTPASPRPLAELVREWYGAYAALRDEDHEVISGTSRRLRAVADEATPRLADELKELAGVLDGSHRHQAFAEDVALEATQCLYWAALVAVRAGIGWEAFGSWCDIDAQWDMSHQAEDRRTVADNLVAAAGILPRGPAGPAFALSRIVPAVVAAARLADLGVADLIAADLAELRTKPYLAGYFGRLAAG